MNDDFIVTRRYDPLNAFVHWVTKKVESDRQKMLDDPSCVCQEKSLIEWLAEWRQRSASFMVVTRKPVDLTEETERWPK